MSLRDGLLLISEGICLCFFFFFFGCPPKRVRYGSADYERLTYWRWLLWDPAHRAHVIVPSILLEEWPLFGWEDISTWPIERPNLYWFVCSFVVNLCQKFFFFFVFFHLALPAILDWAFRSWISEGKEKVRFGRAPWIRSRLRVLLELEYCYVKLSFLCNYAF